MNHSKDLKYPFSNVGNNHDSLKPPPNYLPVFTSEFITSSKCFCETETLFVTSSSVGSLDGKYKFIDIYEDINNYESFPGLGDKIRPDKNNSRRHGNNNEQRINFKQVKTKYNLYIKNIRRKWYIRTKKHLHYGFNLIAMHNSIQWDSIPTTLIEITKSPLEEINR